MTERSLIVLGYHKIGDPGPGGWPTWYYVSQAVFAKQLAVIARSGWTPIDFATLLRGLHDPSVLPERALLVTFDDGYQSMRRCALPALVRAGMPSVVFVPTDYIGGTNSWDDGIEPEEAVCTWDDLRAIEAGGMSVQSHSASHRGFSDIDHERLRRELSDSKAALEANLGKTVDGLAFPYGDPGQDTDVTRAALRDAGYRTAFLYGRDKAKAPLELPVADPFLIDRIPVGAETDLTAILGAEPARGKT